MLNKYAVWCWYKRPNTKGLITKDIITKGLITKDIITKGLITKGLSIKRSYVTIKA